MGCDGFLIDRETGMAMRDGVVVATVKLPPVGDTIVVMAHELQDVTQLTRGLDLKARPGGGAPASGRILAAMRPKPLST